MVSDTGRSDRSMEQKGKGRWARITVLIGGIILCLIIYSPIMLLGLSEMISRKKK